MGKNKEIDTKTLIQAHCGNMLNAIEHAENRLSQAKNDIGIVMGDCTFSERVRAISSIVNHIETVKADMDRVKLNL